MLNFDVLDIADWQRVCTHPSKNEWHPVSHMVAVLSMPCGFNKITPERLEEVTARIMQYQLVAGAALRDGNGNALYITPRDVARLVGLHTNATRMTNGQWKAHLATIVEREAGKLHGNQEAYDVIPPASELWAKAVMNPEGTES